MKRLVLIALSAGFLLQPEVVSAQLAPVPDATEYLDFLGGGPSVTATWGGVRLGPYVARFTTPTSPSFSIFCVDYLHHAGDQRVASTSLASGQTDADMLATRMTGVGSYFKYQQAAYLSSLFESWGTPPIAAAGHATDQATIWSGLHAAIWNITSGQTLGGVGTDTEWWRKEFVTLAAANAGSFGNGWYVLSPTGTNRDGVAYNGQEFLIRTPVSVPEPSTLLLLGTGLLLFYMARRRRPESTGEYA